MERRRSSGVRNLLKFNGRVDIFAESAWTHSAESFVLSLNQSESLQVS